MGEFFGFLTVLNQLVKQNVSIVMMPDEIVNKIFRLLIIAFIVVVADQWTKILVLKNMPLYHSIPVIPGFFRLTHIQNPGGAFGLFAGSSPLIRAIIFLFFSVLASLLVLYYYFKTPKSHPWLANAFAMIFGGAVGNLIDRFQMGRVVDFLLFYIDTYQWPAFNIADSAVSIGFVIIMFHIIFRRLPNI